MRKHRPKRPGAFYLSTVIEISDGMLVRATSPRFKLSRELVTHTLLAAEVAGGTKRTWRLFDLVVVNGVPLRIRRAQRVLAVPIVAEPPLLTAPESSWRHRDSVKARGIPGETIAGCGFRPSLEAQLSMVARRLSHRVVAIGHFPPSSDSWYPPHSTHKFTRATALGECFPRVQ